MIMTSFWFCLIFWVFFVCFFFAALDNNIATDTKECVVIIKSAKIVFFMCNSAFYSFLMYSVCYVMYYRFYIMQVP